MKCPFSGSLEGANRPPQERYPSDYGHGPCCPSQSERLLGRFRSLLRRAGGHRPRDDRRRPDQMDITRADGMYEVISNGKDVSSMEPPSDRMAIYLDETYGPDLDQDNENRLFAIGGFITDDPDQVDRYGAEYPDMFLGGTPEHRRSRVRANRKESGGRTFEEDLRDRPYKYSMLNGQRPLELRYRLNEMNEHLGGDVCGEGHPEDP